MKRGSFASYVITFVSGFFLAGLIVAHTAAQQCG